jgi:dolichyl-phosphate-mannose--protein O-mannosyl transferase
MQFVSQLLQVDTTSASYRIGYQIGSWLPFAFLLVLTVFVVAIVLRRRRRQDPDDQKPLS